MRSRFAASGVLLGVWSLAACPAQGDNGISASEIVIGQSCALSGPAQALGKGMHAGLEACFAAANAEGGINGRKIRLVTLDDGYEPARAIKNVRELLNKDKVFLLIGEVGTPTSKAVVPIVEAEKVPFLSPFSGAEFLRNPFRKYVINVRASYFQEMERLASYLVDSKGVKKIACLYQNDDFGQAGLAGLQKALATRSVELVTTGTYERNTVAVKAALLKIRKAQPGAVVLVGAYKPCAAFIKLAKQAGLADSVFCSISFVGANALLDELGDAAEGCIVSQVVPTSNDSSRAFVSEYQQVLKKYQPQEPPGFVSLEGFIAGKLFCMALQAVPGEPTRETFIETIDKTAHFDIGGLQLEFGPSNHQGMDKVFLTVIHNGTINAQ